MRSIAIRRLVLPALMMLGALSQEARAALAPEISSRVRATVYEVVVPKPTNDPLTYEKPLPLELLPYAERTDKYWPIGSAFALSDTTYATAAHVLMSAVGSQFGPPGIRDREGRVYLVSRVLKFSAHEDFAVFEVSERPRNEPLSIQSDAHLDSIVYAVGNALGEGIIIRDGLLTSMTPEAQDGRWKWLRFSAATSPGNSGGPLLDASGAVLGLIVARSPGENLNFALPIARVLEAPLSARFDTRDSLKLPIQNDFRTVPVRFDFDLPLAFSAFDTKVQRSIQEWYRRERDRLLKDVAGELFPNGKASTLLASTHSAYLPTFVAEQENDEWGLAPSSASERFSLRKDGRLWTQVVGAYAAFRVRVPTEVDPLEIAKDAKASMDLMLEVVNLPRYIGSQPIRITSMGKPRYEQTTKDRFGRSWVLREWPLGFADAVLTMFSTPTPEGFSGFFRLVMSGDVTRQRDEFAFLADYVYLSYAGALPQWSAFLAASDLRPTPLSHVTLDYRKGEHLTYRTPRLEAMIHESCLPISEDTFISVKMAYRMEDDRLRWGPSAVYIADTIDEKSFVALIRHVAPASDADDELLTKWTEMREQRGYFSPERGHDADWKSFWRRTPKFTAATDAAGVPRAGYELLASSKAANPLRIDDMHRRLESGVKILE